MQSRRSERHQAVYLIAVGGAAFLVSKAIKRARVLAFEDLGMEAIYEFEVEDMPVTVAVDVSGESVHQVGPTYWKQKISGTTGRDGEQRMSNKDERSDAEWKEAPDIGSVSSLPQEGNRTAFLR